MLRRSESMQTACIRCEIRSTSDAWLPLSFSVKLFLNSTAKFAIIFETDSYSIAVHLWARLWCKHSEQKYVNKSSKSVCGSDTWMRYVVHTGCSKWRCGVAEHRLTRAILSVYRDRVRCCGIGRLRQRHPWKYALFSALWFFFFVYMRTLAQHQQTPHTSGSDVRENNMRCTCVPLAPIDRKEELTKTKRSINLIKYNVCWRTVPSFRCSVLWFSFRLLFSAFIHIFSFAPYRMSAPPVSEPPCAVCFANIFQFFSQYLRLSSFSLFSFVDDIYVFCLENICIYQKQTKCEEFSASCFNLSIAPWKKLKWDILLTHTFCSL